MRLNASATAAIIGLATLSGCHKGEKIAELSNKDLTVLTKEDGDTTTISKIPDGHAYETLLIVDNERCRIREEIFRGFARFPFQASRIVESPEDSDRDIANYTFLYKVAENSNGRLRDTCF